MKKQVKFSTWSTMLSASAIIVLLYVLKYTKDDMPYWCIIIALMLIVLVAVTLRDGRKYMLGCDDAGEMVSAINSRLCVA